MGILEACISTTMNLRVIAYNKLSNQREGQSVCGLKQWLEKMTKMPLLIH
jgi:hypothetical protein